MDGAEFRAHREKILELFRQKDLNDGAIIFEGGMQPKEPFSGSDLPFTQEALFFWLTGWSKPGAALVIELATGKHVLITQDYDEHYEIWNGPIPSDEEVKSATGVDQVIRMMAVEEYIEKLAPTTVYQTTLSLKNLKGFLPEGCKIDKKYLIGATSIARAIKSEKEIDALRKASELTGQAIVETWKSWKFVPGMKEMAAEALFQYHGTMLGCKNLSFLTIAGAGGHSCNLHYSENTGTINEGDLLLLDCGLFYNHYAGDITRTFPVSGKFNEDQKLVYSLLLKEQIRLIELVKPGITIGDLNNEMYVSIFHVLQGLNLIPEDAPYEKKYANFFCPHSLSHHIGCNVHDQCRSPYTQLFDVLDSFWTMKPGMIISIEPGIYFHKTRLEKMDQEEFPLLDIEKAKKFAVTVGGIRIEDDVLVTEDGYDVLSQNCPKSVEEIEALLKRE